MSGLRLDTWQRAEASLQKPAIVGRAASALPTRAALILQGLDALQRNDLGRLRALAVEAEGRGAKDVAASLRLLTAAPGSDAARAAIEGAQALPGLPLCGPSLADALRALEAARVAPVNDSGEIPPEPPAPAPDAPPACAALAALLVATPGRPCARAALAQRLSPRADQVQVAAGSMRVFGDADDATVETYCAQLSQLDLDGGGWVDAAPSAYAPFVAWCEDPDLLWSSDQDEALSALGYYGDREQHVPYQRLVLGALLRRVRQSVADGKLAAVLPVMADAVGWAAQTRAFPTALRQQCAALSERVAWLNDDDPSPAFIEAMWRGRGPHLSHEARLMIAQRAADAAPSPETDALRIECVCYLIAHLEDVDAVCMLIEDHFTESDRAALTQGLKAAKAAAPRAAFALGLHAALSGLTAQALDAALAALNPTGEDKQGPLYSMELLVRLLSNLQDKSKPLSPALKRGLGELFGKLAALDDKVPPRLCPPLALLLQMSSYGLTEGARALIYQGALSQPLVTPSDLGQSAGALDTLTAQVAALGLLEAPEAAEALKVLGRTLRKHADPDAADVWALRAASQLASWLPPTPPTLREAYMTPMTQFLLRDGDGERAAAAAGRLTSLPPGLVEWYLVSRASLGHPDIWHPLLMEALELPVDPIPQHMLKLLGEVLEQGPEIVSSLQLLDALYEASTAYFDEDGMFTGDLDDDDAFEDDDADFEDDDDA